MNNPATQHVTEEPATGTTLTRVRYRVVAFTIALAGVTYLDRVCISILAPNIMRDLKLTAIQMSYVFSAFTLAYAIFENPNRALGRSRRKPPGAHTSCFGGRLLPWRPQQRSPTALC